MEPVSLSNAFPPEDQRFYLLSWFGTFLSSQARYDWIEHRPLSSNPNENNLLFVQLQNEAVVSSQLLKQVTAPRALPHVMIIRKERRQVALRCIKTTDSQDMLNHFIAAIPGGAVEINRSYISQWETYLLLSTYELNTLNQLLYSSIIENETGGACALCLNEGFILEAASKTFDLRDLIEKEMLTSIESLEYLVDTRGHQVRLLRV